MESFGLAYVYNDATEGCEKGAGYQKLSCYLGNWLYFYMASPHIEKTVRGWACANATDSSFMIIAKGKIYSFINDPTISRSWL